MEGLREQDTQQRQHPVLCNNSADRPSSPSVVVVEDVLVRLTFCALRGIRRIRLLKRAGGRRTNKENTQVSTTVTPGAKRP